MVNHDIHIHTSLSSCADETAKPDWYIQNAKKLGLKIIGFSDHLWDSDVYEPTVDQWYVPQNFEHISKVRQMITEPLDGLKVLFGCECEFAKASIMGITEEHAAKLDYVLTPHSHTHFDFVMAKELGKNPETHKEYLLKSFMGIVNHPLKKYVTAIVHPFLPVLVTDEYCQKIAAMVTDAQYRECFSAAKEAGIALEINTSVFKHYQEEEALRNNQYIRMFKIAKACGCKFTIGTDSHRTSDYAYFPLAERVMKLCGITSDDFLDFLK